MRGIEEALAAHARAGERVIETGESRLVEAQRPRLALFGAPRALVRDDEDDERQCGNQRERPRQQRRIEGEEIPGKGDTEGHHARLRETLETGAELREDGAACPHARLV